MGFPKHRVAAAVLVLQEDGKILLVQGRRRGWEFPGGYVEEGEPIRTAAIREVKEETGIDVHLTKYCGMYQDVRRSVLTCLFMGRPVSGELKTSAESVAIGYFTLEEALDKVTWRNFRERIIRCLNEQEHPFLIEF